MSNIDILSKRSDINLTFLGLLSLIDNDFVKYFLYFY